MGYGLAAALNSPLAEARGFESILLDIGQKANLTDDQIARLSKRIGGLSVYLKKTLSQTDLAKGVDFLAGMGLDPDNAVKMLEPIGRAAHAYKADVEDLSRAGYAAFANLQVPADQFTKALDAMAQSGKEGAFELRDMARYFPSLGSTFQGLGQTGVGAVADLSAALQVARKGAGDSEEAATNLGNVLQKIVAPDAVKKFKKFGIDVRKELLTAQKTRKSPIEMIAELTNKALKGNLSNISDLFEDAQVQKGLRAIILNLEEYRRIRKKALQSEGVVNGDFARRLLTGDAALDQFKNRMADLGRIIGTILLPNVNDILKASGEWASQIAEIAEKHPGLTRAVVGLAAGAIALRVAAIGAAFAGRFMFGGMIGGALAAVTSLSKLKRLGALAFAPILAFGARVKGILQIVALRFRLARAAGIGFGRVFAAGAAATMVRAIMSLLAPLALVRASLKLLKIALIGTGIGAAFVGLGILAEWVANNWQGIQVAWEAFKGSFMRGIAPIRERLAPVLDRLGELSNGFESLTSATDNGTWAERGIQIGQRAAELAIKLVEMMDATVRFGEQVGQVFADIKHWLVDVDCTEAGRQAIQSLWDGMVSKFDELIAWVKEIPSRIVSAIGSIDLSGMIQWPSMPSWFGGGEPEAPAPSGSAPAAPPARARGGPVKAGHLYRVNDDGSDDPVELFRPGKSGTILPSSERRKMAGAGGGTTTPTTVNQNLTFNIAGGNAQEIADEVLRRINGSSRFGSISFADASLRGA
ncbi:phage tail tape measure protein [Aureimonas ureilytica]|uniref:phage tail tape measure protein n=1 Tax=Aureimonas ureilytica TaxID=401562 RepID=UPI001FCCC65B|nr:phage tail tape measure protein [Aureimonas ureilytica]